MDHPSEERFVELLYGEAGEADEKALRAHLEGCTECRERFESWRGVMAGLDEWPLEAPAPSTAPSPTPPRRIRGGLVWRAAAAAVLLAAGFWLGLAGRGGVDEAALEARLASKLEARIWDELLTHVAADFDESTARLVSVVSGEIARLDSRQATANAALVELAQAYRLQERNNARIATTLLEEFEARREADRVWLSDSMNLLAASAAEGIVSNRIDIAYLASFLDAKSEIIESGSSREGERSIQ